MKWNKFFMLGVAGLALCACNNEDEVTNGNPAYDGNGVVSVKIVKPVATKAMTSGTSVAISGNITVTLIGKKVDGTDYSESIVIASDKLENTTELKFWNIAEPEKLTASINGGIASYASTAITTTTGSPATPLWQVAPTSAPAYGETTTFTLTNEKDSPNLSNDNDGTNNGTEAGAETGDDAKEYDMYKASVDMAIPMARLEVGKISFEAPSGGSIYSSVTYTGCYMNGYSTNGGAYTEATTEEPAAPAQFAAVVPGSFNMEFENTTSTAGVTVSELKYAAGDNHDFITTPINGNDGDCSAFNFYASTTNPRFTLYFKTGTVSDNRQFPRYAYINNYKNEEGESITLQNGHIYQITDVKLSDDNFVPDPNNPAYGVEVTVTEAVWTVESVSADWAEQ